MQHSPGWIRITSLLLALILIILPSMSNSFSFTNSNKAERRPKSRYYDDFVKTLPTLKGKTIAITGCSRGLGFVTALTVVQKGGRAIILNRKGDNNNNNNSSKEGEEEEEWYQQLCKVATGPRPIKVECDLLSFDSVQRACDQVRHFTKDTGLDVLVLNAGIMLQADVASKDGYDITASTNMLSHFLITKELFQELVTAKRSRIVIMSSASGYGGPAFNPTFFQRRGGNLGGSQASYERYHQSKLANLAFCSALKDKIEASSNRNASIHAVACTPGVCGTDMFLHATTVMNGKPAPLSAVPSVEDGAMAQLKCIFDPEITSGDLWGPGKNGMLVKTPIEPPLILVNDDTKTKLWKVCEDAVGKFDII